MKEKINVSDDVIANFHQMWDCFPGSVRLIHKSYVVLAYNIIAQANAPKDDEVVKCINQGELSSHKGCKSRLMLKTQQGQIDRPSPEKIRGWIPVQGHDDIYVHFGLQLPDL